MSDEQDPTAWGHPIPTARQEALQTTLNAWNAPDAAHGKRKGPFADVALTGAEVCWLAEQSGRGSFNEVPNLHLEGANLTGANLEGANLIAAHLEGALLVQANLEDAHLGVVDPKHRFVEGGRAYLADAEDEEEEKDAEYKNLGAHLEGADLLWANLESATLNWAHLEGARLAMANLEAAAFIAAHLEGANIIRANLRGAWLLEAHLEDAHLEAAHLMAANFSGAHLEGAHLRGAHLEAAILNDAHLEGRVYASDDAELKRLLKLKPDIPATLSRANLFPATLRPADLREAFLDHATTGLTICAPRAHEAIRVVDVRWNNVNLAVLDWTPCTEGRALLGDEQEAREWLPERYKENPKLKQATRRARAEARKNHADEQRRARIDAWAGAARANRQVAATMRGQGMHDEADHFSYRAQVCQRRLLSLRGKPGQAFFSLVLDALAGYGFRPGRTLTAYLVVVFGFALVYWLIGPLAHHTFAFDGALVFSVTSFHGRGFFPGGLSLENWITRLAALEAVIGLLIEISFIATFTQRFFGAK